MKKTALILIIFLSYYGLYSQVPLSQGGGAVPFEKESNCLSPEQRVEIKLMLEKNKADLEARGILEENFQKDGFIVAFDWPLRKTDALSYNSYYSTNNFVDQNTGNGLLDYHCDARTYNGHRGTDIDTWPFPWYLYDNNMVEIIAGEAGIIMGKTDGNEDDHCSCRGNWNAVFVQHADGSTAWYGHLKRNSLTSKSIGQSVAKGEYLGVLASSGCSTGPHLHFEVYDSSNKLIDPYTGGCNSLNGSSWWADQRSNRESTLNAVLTHDDIPVHGCPGRSESPNFADSFSPEQTIYMATYYHDQLRGELSTLDIKRPDGSIWRRWSHTAPETYTRSWWWWSWNLPADEPFGSWTFEVTYKGQSYIHEFQYGTSVPVDKITELEISVFPNPTNDFVYISNIDNQVATIYDVYGRCLMSKENSTTFDFSSFPKGVYFLHIEHKNRKIVKRILKE